MANRIFHVSDDRAAIYKNKWTMASGTTTAYNGYAMEIASDGTLGVSNAATDTIFGLLYEPTMPTVEWPTVSAYADEVNVATHLAGKKVQVIAGRFIATVGKGLFAQTAFPSIGGTVYNFGDGRLSNVDPGSGTSLGTYLGTAQLSNSNSNDSGQTYETVGLVEFSF